VNPPYPLDKYGRREKEWSEDGMRQIVRSGHKAFDRQTSALCCGQQIGDTILSFCVRPHSELECNDRTFRPGELRRSDVDRFGRCLSESAKHWLQENPEFKGIVYTLTTCTKNPERVYPPPIVIQGTIIADSEDRLVRVLWRNDRRSTPVVLTALQYVVHWDSLKEWMQESICEHVKDQEGENA
jgi:hypothetical protein